ncbi:hypothetical protein GOGPGP_GOGPGP_05605, partial [Dysosmobacter welbionis]
LCTAGDRLPRQLQRRHLAGGPLGCHRPADCPGPDGVFRPALYLPHGPDAGHRVC